MDQMEPRRPAQAYEDYFVPAVFARWAPLLIQHASPQRGERVLDLACGTGIVARSIAPLVRPDGRVVGVDISPQMLEVASESSAPQETEIEWIQGEAGSLPGNGFDLILCQQGLQFFPDRAGAVREMKRVLNPDGRVVLSVWEDLERQPVYRALCEAEARHLGVPLEQVARPFMFGDPWTLRQLFVDAGFRRVEVVVEEREVHFPSADQFVALTILGASAVIPELAKMGAAEREDLVLAVNDEVRPILEEFVQPDGVSFRMSSNIAVAYV